MPYQKESNVPLPPEAGGKGEAGRGKGELRIALEGLNVGDSLLVTDRNRNTINSKCYAVRVTKGFHFAVRVVEGGFRVWRVK